MHQRHDQTPAPSVTNDSGTQDTPVTQAANAAASISTPAANTAPSLVFKGRKSKQAELISLATKAYQCLVERIKRDQRCRFGRADILEMLGAEVGKRFSADVNKGYLSTENIIHAARLQELNKIVIVQGRLLIFETAKSKSNET